MIPEQAAIVDIQDPGYPPAFERLGQAVDEGIGALAEVEAASDDQPTFVIDDCQQVALAQRAPMGDAHCMQGVGLPHVIAQLHLEAAHVLLLLLRLLVMEAEVAVDGGKGDTLGLGDDVAPVCLLDHLLDREGGFLLANLQEGRERLVADAPGPSAIAAVGGEQGLDLLAALAVALQPVEDGGPPYGGAFAERDLPFALAQLLQDLLLVAPGEPLLLE